MKIHQSLILLSCVISLAFQKAYSQNPTSAPPQADQQEQPAPEFSEKGKLAAAILNAQIMKEANLMSRLASTNRKEGLGAAVELGMARRGLIEKLLTIVKDTNSINQKLPAIVVLGEYRESQAAPILAEHLEWDDSVSGEITGFARPTIEKLSLECCPVTTALEQIGQPSIAPLLERIKQTDDAKITAKCILVCKQIEGIEITRFRLREQLEREADPKKKGRIESALKTLKN
jgi:hypothetical protein